LHGEGRSLFWGWTKKKGKANKDMIFEKGKGVKRGGITEKGEGARKPPAGHKHGTEGCEEYQKEGRDA